VGSGPSTVTARVNGAGVVLVDARGRASKVRALWCVCVCVCAVCVCVCSVCVCVCVCARVCSCVCVGGVGSEQPVRRQRSVRVVPCMCVACAPV
jgi:hypothetical protein